MIVPIKLTNPLNGAQGCHWAVKASRRAKDRKAIHYSWLEAKMPRTLEPGQRIRITRIGPRRLDGDNLQAACKAVRDAVAVLVGINDRLDVWDYAQELGKYAVRVEIINGL